MNNVSMVQILNGFQNKCRMYQIRLEYEPVREKINNLPMRKQRCSAFVLATRIVQSLFFLNPKFEASSHLLCLYSPACVGPGQKPKLLVFSRTGSYLNASEYSTYQENILLNL